jgi:SAM-dependent methyltransferase
VSDAVEEFIDQVRKSVSAGDFIKLTLSNYKGTEDHLQKLSVRVIETKAGRRLLFQIRYATRDVAKNYDSAKGTEEIARLLDSGFRSGHLFTSVGDFQLTVGKRSSRLVKGRSTLKAPESLDHDRPKKTLVDPNALYLKALGIATDSGDIRASQRDKWRQINKYVEILASLYDKSPLNDRQELRIVDMGSGKGYLTFAAYDHFSNVLGRKVSMTGVEVRKDLVSYCNDVAAACGFEGLKFATSDIANFDAGEVDMLIALHACDTATDDAIFKGIMGKASIIVASPCCHKEVRGQIKPPAVLYDILKHGSMLEREAETVTDGLRSMLLERSGYSTKVFEFVPTTHTPKNNMITAIRVAGTSPGSRIQERIDALKAFYGIEQQRLENLLA